MSIYAVEDDWDDYITQKIFSSLKKAEDYCHQEMEKHLKFRKDNEGLFSKEYNNINRRFRICEWKVDDKCVGSNYYNHKNE